MDWLVASIEWCVVVDCLVIGKIVVVDYGLIVLVDELIYLERMFN